MFISYSYLSPASRSSCGMRAREKQRNPDCVSEIFFPTMKWKMCRVRMFPIRLRSGVPLPKRRTPINSASGTFWKADATLAASAARC